MSLKKYIIFIIFLKSLLMINEKSMLMIFSNIWILKLKIIF